MTLSSPTSSPFRRVLTNAPVYSMGEVAQATMAVLFLPIYTRLLSPTEYGAAILTLVIARFGAVFASFHLQSAIIRFMFDAPEDNDYHKRLIGTVFVFILIVSVGFLGFSFLALGPVFDLLDIPHFWLPYAFFSAVIAASTSVYEILQRILQAGHEARRYVALQASFVVFTSGVTFALLVGTNLGGLSIVIGAASANAIYFGYAFVYVRMRYGFAFDRALLISCLAYSARLFPNRLAGLLPRIADRFFVSTISIGSAGVYSVGYRLGEGLSYLSGGFFRAHLPWFYSAMNAGESSRGQIIYVARRAILLISVGGILVSFAAEEVVRVALDLRFAEAWKIVPLAASAVVYNSVKEFWLRPLTYDKQTIKYVPLATYSFVILSIALTAIAVPIFGIFGAAGALLVARIVSSFFMLYLSLRHANLGYPVIELYTLATASLVVSSIAYLPINGLVPIKLLIATVIVAGVAVSIRNDVPQLRRVLWPREAAAPS